MNRFFLRDLQIDTVIGVYDWERQIRQVVSLNLEWVFDIGPAARSDQLQDTVSYHDVAQRVTEYVQNSRFGLIETLIERVAEILLYEFNLPWVRVRLNKLQAVPAASAVGLEIVRERQATQPQTVYVGIGSNVEPLAQIQSALSALENEFGALTISTIYRNPAVGFAGAEFCNAVLEFCSALPPAAISVRLRQIEAMHGRDRQQPQTAERGLDLDLLLYGEQIIEQDNLRLPRQDLIEYAFVLKPLAELAADKTHPVVKKTFGELWAQFPAADVELIPVNL